ncbi:lysoplasmalogenase [Sphingomonas aliaeris]|uniref:Lysoplasmalogenase n=1 Tax=Sphingomonas aliaeris TaxID=2759526 RepID=A0A974S2S7_9SPHN|nr:lysoplasmalogenase family protein [Sphingomonas aliaeris]QQV75894.1 lysoplasmalogenase [Sphingomonas aliaeris]
MNRLILAAALIAGIGFQLVKDLPPAPMIVAWKGAGVALLAIWAGSQARDRDGWLIAAALAFGALGDVLLETSGTVPGALAFLVGHVVAITLYLRCRRGSIRKSIGTATGIGLIVAIMGYLLTRDLGVAVYAFGLGAMAGGALASRFVLPLVGPGVVLFIGSDLLIFAKGSALAGSALPGLMIWPTYFAAQALIAIGVVRGLHGHARRPISAR